MLNETCMLVDLSISLPPQTKIAKAASEDVERKYQTAKRQGRVTKLLFSNDDIKPLTQASTAARARFNELSLPYDEAYRIIPTSSYFKFAEEMGELSMHFDTKKHEFLREYDNIKRKARLVLGSLYDERDYPASWDLDAKIRFKLSSSVLPDITAFDNLAGLTPDAVETLKEQAVEAQNQKIEQALHDLFDRLFTSLHKAHVKLSNADSIFRDTLIGNIKDALYAVETLNLTGNQELIALADEVKATLDNIEPEDLRKDKKLRQTTADSAKQLLDKMEEFF